MDCEAMKRIFRMTPRSDDMVRSIDQTKFEEWFISVAKDTTSWDGSYPVCMWQFDRDEIDVALSDWKAKKSTNNGE